MFCVSIAMLHAMQLVVSRMVWFFQEHSKSPCSMHFAAFESAEQADVCTELMLWFLLDDRMLV